jgi:ribosomal-protein-serine acetyltransferase
MFRRFFVDERTVLRPISDSDVQPLFEAVDRNRAHLRRFLPWLDSTREAADIEAFRTRTLEQERDGIGLTRVIETAAAIGGIVGFNHIDLFNRRAELGYWIDRTLEGRGICRQSCSALIRYAFEELDLNRIAIAAAVDNRRSRALAERLGFTQEGVRREAEWLYDHFVDHAMYGLLRREWRDREIAK